MEWSVEHGFVGRTFRRSTRLPEQQAYGLDDGREPLLGQATWLIFAGMARDWKIRKPSAFWIASKGEEDPAPFLKLAIGPDIEGKLR